MTIRPALVSSLVLLAAAFGAAPAAALTCYMVLDRSENVVYRDTYPPVDLSDQGAADRERMRRRGEHLIAMEADRCPTLEFFLGNAGTSNLNVDQMVGGVPVRNTLSAPGVAITPSSGATGTGGGAAPAPARSAPKGNAAPKY